MDERKKKQ
jgi:hypothetical protein